MSGNVIASNAHAYHSKVKSSKTVKISRAAKPEYVEPMMIAVICPREIPALDVGDSVEICVGVGMAVGVCVAVAVGIGVGMAVVVGADVGVAVGIGVGVAM